MDANGELTFSTVNGETYCDSSPGRGHISDAATCLSAVESLGMPPAEEAYSVYEEYSETTPPGCNFRRVSQSINFNHNFASTADCSSRDAGASF